MLIIELFFYLSFHKTVLVHLSFLSLTGTQDHSLGHLPNQSVGERSALVLLFLSLCFVFFTTSVLNYDNDTGLKDKTLNIV